MYHLHSGSVSHQIKKTFPIYPFQINLRKDVQPVNVKYVFQKKKKRFVKFNKKATNIKKMNYTCIFFIKLVINTIAFKTYIAYTKNNRETKKKQTWYTRFFNQCIKLSIYLHHGMYKHITKTVRQVLINIS